MEALSRMGAWQVVASRIHREVDAIRANLTSVPDIDKLRQLQGSAQALEGLLTEISGAQDVLRRQG
jgi:dihydroorotate dehydrogenase